MCFTREDKGNEQSSLAPLGHFRFPQQGDHRDLLWNSQESSTDAGSKVNNGEGWKGKKKGRQEPGTRHPEGIHSSAQAGATKCQGAATAQVSWALQGNYGAGKHHHPHTCCCQSPPGLPTALLAMQLRTHLLQITQACLRQVSLKLCSLPSLANPCN